MDVAIHFPRLPTVTVGLQNGLKPGKEAGISKREWAFLAAFASGDKRNLAAGRQEKMYDHEILFDDKRAVVRDKSDGSELCVFERKPGGLYIGKFRLKAPSPGFTRQG